MPGLVPGIHVFLRGSSARQDVDGRDKPGHDGVKLFDVTNSRFTSGREDMPRLLRFSETAGCGATIELDNSDVVYVSVAQIGILVRLWDMKGELIKSLMSNFLVQNCTMKATSIRTHKRRVHSASCSLNKLHLCVFRIRC